MYVFENASSYSYRKSSSFGRSRISRSRMVVDICLSLSVPLGKSLPPRPCVASDAGFNQHLVLFERRTYQCYLVLSRSSHEQYANGQPPAHVNLVDVR